MADTQKGSAEGSARRSAALGLWVVGLGTLINPLDTSVNIAFPAITAAFGIPLADIQWVVISYVLTYASLMLAFGKLGDLYGHRRVFAAGLALSAVSFVWCGMAESYAMLLAARVLQGIGTALVVGVGPALATGLYDETRRARILGVYTMMYGIGAAIGPLVGGVLIEEWGWSAVYWFRLPLSLVALSLCFLLPAHAPTAGRTARFDILGAALMVTGLCALLLMLNRLRGVAEDAALVAGLALVAAVALTGFVLQERRAADPIIRLLVFRRPGFAVANLTCAATQAVSFTVLLLVPYFLVRNAGLPLWLAGIVLAASPAGIIVGGPLGGRLTGRLPAERMVPLAAIATGLALLPVALWTAGTGPWLIAAMLFVHGLMLGLFQLAYLDLCTAALPRAERGVAGSLAMATRTVGIMLGASVMAALFTGLEQTAIGTGEPADAAFLWAFRWSFACAGGGLLGYLVLTLLVGWRPRTG